MQIPSAVLEGGPFTSWELVIKETFNLNELYKKLYEYLQQEEWFDLETGGADFESFYRQIHHEDGTRDHYFWWRAYKEPLIGGSSYIRYYAKLDFFTLRMGQKEVMHNGKKVKLDSGELKIKASFYLSQHDGALQGDDKENWSTHPILKHFKKFFWDRMHSKVVSSAKKEILGQSNNLYQIIQIYTGAMNEGKKKDFWPQKGIHN